MKKYILAGLLALCSVALMAQKTERTVYLYSFENVTNQEQADKLAADVLKVSFIVEAKVKCKWENKVGELIFVTEVIITGIEDMENPDLSVVKSIIISNGLTPVECIKRTDK